MTVVHAGALRALAMEPAVEAVWIVASPDWVKILFRQTSLWAQVIKAFKNGFSIYFCFPHKFLTCCIASKILTAPTSGHTFQGVCVWGGAPVKPISRTLKCVHMFKKCSTASIICVISFGQLQRSLLDPWHTSDLMDWTKPISDLLVFLSKFGYPKWLFQTLPTPLENLIYSIAEVFPKVGHPSTHTPSLNFYWNLSLLGFLNTCFIKFHLVYFNF